MGASLRRDLQFKTYKEFQSSRNTFEDSDLCGRPVTVVAEQKVAKVKCPIKEDARMTENEIKDGLNLSLGIGFFVIT